MSLRIIQGDVVLDFYCRYVYVRCDLTCEHFVLNLASRLWWVWPTFPGWSGRYQACESEANIPPDLLRRGVEVVETWETINTDESATDLVNRLFRLFSSTV